MRPSDNVYPIERIISAATYLTVGFVGFVWMVIAMLMKRRVTTFIMYHTAQSIFLSISYFILFKLYTLVFVIIVRIPIINRLIILFDSLINGSFAILYGMSLLQVFTSAIILYLAITSFMGIYSYIPWVSNIVNINIGRK